MGSFQSCSALRSASPDSKSPVHWIITSGRFPPRWSPAATAHASPSRHTRTRRTPGVAEIADSHAPIVLSGTVTTWVTPRRVKSAAISAPENTAVSPERERRRAAPAGRSSSSKVPPKAGLGEGGSGWLNLPAAGAGRSGRHAPRSVILIRAVGRAGGANGETFHQAGSTSRAGGAGAAKISAGLRGHTRRLVRRGAARVGPPREGED